MRTCRICGQEKPLDAFPRNRGCRDERDTRCSECNRAAVKAWAQQNAARVRARRQSETVRARERKRDRARPRSQRNTVQRAWWARHGERVNTQRRAAGSRVARDLATRAYLEVLRADPCSYCGRPCEEIDHIEPRSTGGSRRWHNLTAACKSCNSSKRATPLLRFMARS